MRYAIALVIGLHGVTAAHAQSYLCKPQGKQQFCMKLEPYQGMKPDAVLNAEVACPDGMDATGGGFFIRQSQGRLVPVASYPKTPEGGWRVSAKNISLDTVDGQLEVYALCR